MAVCVSDDTAIPLVLADDVFCSEHGAVEVPVYMEVTVAGERSPQTATAFCQDCIDELDWVLSTVTYAPVRR
jgi:hypothetical protein